ncbi:hypothetical protein C8R43DRAFT_1235469, partial [Mycena crocata]
MLATALVHTPIFPLLVQSLYTMQPESLPIWCFLSSSTFESRTSRSEKNILHSHYFTFHTMSHDWAQEQLTRLAAVLGVINTTSNVASLTHSIFPGFHFEAEQSKIMKKADNMKDETLNELSTWHEAMTTDAMQLLRVEIETESSRIKSLMKS